MAGHVQPSLISTRLLEAPGTSGINLRHFPSLSHFAKYRCFFNVQASVKFLICISVALLHYIFRKYDEVVSINDIPVSESDQNLVKSLLDGAVTTLNMVRLELLVISFASQLKGIGVEVTRKLESIMLSTRRLFLILFWP